jgi:hypothetical protein
MRFRSDSLSYIIMRVSDPPPTLSIHALPRSHSASIILMGGHQAGYPATRPVVIPLSMGVWVRVVRIAFTAITPLRRSPYWCNV